MNIAGGTSTTPMRIGRKGFASSTILPSLQPHLLDAGDVSNIVIVDCDVHQGNGSAVMLANELVSRPFPCMAPPITPCTKRRATSTLRCLDGTSDGAYLETLERHLDILIPKDGPHPNLVMYQCGVDVLLIGQTGQVGADHVRMRGTRSPRLCAVCNPRHSCRVRHGWRIFAQRQHRGSSPRQHLPRCP